MGALAAALPMRVMGEDDRRAMVGIYRDAVLAQHGVTDDDLDRAAALLVRTLDWWPTLRQLLDAARGEADRRERMEAATAVAGSPSGDGKARAVSSGEWDRAAARARVVSRLRRERHAVLLAAYWRDAGGLPRDPRRRGEGHLAVAHLIAGYWPEPDEDAIRDELGTMAKAGLLARRKGAGDEDGTEAGTGAALLARGD